MKVFISADMEGVSGVVAMDDVLTGKPGYPAACKAMTLDVNAAVEVALTAGAEEVVVFDAHAGGRNIDLELLHPSAEIIRGQPAPAFSRGNHRHCGHGNKQRDRRRNSDPQPGACA